MITLTSASSVLHIVACLSFMIAVSLAVVVGCQSLCLSSAEWVFVVVVALWREIIVMCCKCDAKVFNPSYFQALRQCLEVSKGGDSRSYHRHVFLLIYYCFSSLPFLWKPVVNFLVGKNCFRKYFCQSPFYRNYRGLYFWCFECRSCCVYDLKGGVFLPVAGIFSISSPF